jgi:hypothetical protein
MASKEEVEGFIRATFRSVWSLELLVLLSDKSERAWSREELVSTLRASELIVAQSLDALLAAGLISVDENGCAAFLPASRDIEDLFERAKSLYARTPDAVRRMIVASASGGLTAFADAFRLRKD